MNTSDINRIASTNEVNSLCMILVIGWHRCEWGFCICICICICIRTSNMSCHCCKSASALGWTVMRHGIGWHGWDGCGAALLPLVTSFVLDSWQERYWTTQYNIESNQVAEYMCYVYGLHHVTGELRLRPWAQLSLHLKSSKLNSSQLNSSQLNSTQLKSTILVSVHRL